MTPLTDDQVLRCKIGLYRWLVRNGHARSLVPGFRCYYRAPNGSVVAVKACGAQCRQQLTVFRELARIPGPAIFDETVRGVLAPYMPALEAPTPTGTVRRPPVGHLLRYDVVSHGQAPKNLIVLHETISPDAPGISDIRNVGDYLEHVGYGIHAIVDAEGLAAAVEPVLEDDIFWHAQSGTGGVNTRGIGIEQVSLGPGKVDWSSRATQIDAVARWCAYFCKRHGIRPVYDPTCTSGITGHWDVTRTYLGGSGHYDCRAPYPLADVALRAEAYLEKGWA